MLSTGIVFLIANIICALGTFLQILAVLKNRKVLRGYSFIGSFLTFLAILFFQYGFYLLDEELSLVFGLVPLIYWFLVTLYTGIKGIKGWKWKI